MDNLFAALALLSHLLTVLIVYWTNRRVNNANIPFSFLSGLYLAVGTGLSYVSAYFGTPFFALAAASTWTLGLILIQKENPRFGLILAFALSGLVTGLIRPEGVILASLMLLAIIVMRGLKNSISIIVTFGAVFLLLGGAYFLWRWNYFGYPLPNPFYKKGDSGLHWDSYNNSLLNLLRLCLPIGDCFHSRLSFARNRKADDCLSHSHPWLCRRLCIDLRRNELRRAFSICTCADCAHVVDSACAWIKFLEAGSTVGLGKRRVLRRIDRCVCQSHLLFVVSKLLPHILSTDLCASV